MNKNDISFQIRSKIWIEDSNGDVIFGYGRYRIMEAIDRCGSLNAAAKELKMSYRGIWGKIRSTEESIGAPLLTRNTGGVSGGGSQLTPLAKKIMKEYKRMQEHVINESDTYFENVFIKNIE